MKSLYFTAIETKGCIFNSALKRKCLESTHSRLQMHCIIRWVEKQEAVRIFKELLSVLRVSLEQIRFWSHQECCGKALILQSAIDGAFLVTLEIFLSLLEVTKPLSVRVQSSSQDIHYAMKAVTDAVSVLQQMRDDESAYFTPSFNGLRNHMVMKSQYQAQQEDRQIMLTTREMMPDNTIGRLFFSRISMFVSSSCVIDFRLTMQMHKSSVSSCLPIVIRQKSLQSMNLPDCTTSSRLEMWIALKAS